MKYTLIKFVSIVFFIIINLNVYSQITLNEIDKIKLIGKNTLLYEDKTSKLTFEEISSPSFKNKFIFCELDVPNFGLTHSTIWCKIIVQNNTELNEWFLEVGNPVLDSVTLFSPIDSANFKSQTLSYYFKFDQREIKSNNFVYKLNIQSKTSATYYLKIRCEKAVNFPLKIIPENQFIEYNHVLDLAYGIYFGLIIIMILYNLFIFFSVRDKNYIFYVLYIFFIGFMNADLKGIAFEFFWPDIPQINPYLPVLGISTCIFAMFFVNSFLELKKNTNKIIYGIWIFIQLLNIIALFFTFSKMTSLAVTTSLIITLISSIYSFSVGIFLLLKKYKPAKFFVIAWTWLLAGVIIYILLDLGLVPYNYFTTNAVLIGSSLEIIFLGFALADKIKLMEIEKNKAQSEVLESIKENERIVCEQNIMLEQKVKERTLEIENQKEELKTKSDNLLEAYNLLSEQKEEINQQKEEIQTIADNLLVTNTKVSTMNDELSKVNNEVLSKNKKITDSIQYALKIQKALNPTQEFVSQIFPEHFIFYKPRDIVSGDFYFVKKVNNIKFIAVADCTGHGVPGAFLSMLVQALLNEIVRRKDITKSNAVLDELRNQIKNSLHQTGQKGEGQDGLDIAFCAINSETLEMNFAGAHNPCWIYRNEELGTFSAEQITNYELEKNEELTTQNSKFIILEADRQPVGVFSKEKPFTEHIFQLQKNDIIYLFSDGFTSQFGGVKDEKFKTKQFKELFSKIYFLPLSEQKNILETKFNEWQGNNGQTDDVLVIGVKI